MVSSDIILHVKFPFQFNVKMQIHFFWYTTKTRFGVSFIAFAWFSVSTNLQTIFCFSFHELLAILLTVNRWNEILLEMCNGFTNIHKTFVQCPIHCVQGEWNEFLLYQLSSSFCFSVRAALKLYSFHFLFMFW